MKLSGKTAVVTGASKGIGAGIAKALAAAGATVIVNYASGKSHADEVVSKIVIHSRSRWRARCGLLVCCTKKGHRR